MEIYNEMLRDLLNPKSSFDGSVATSLKIREAPDKGIWVENLTEQVCSTNVNEMNTTTM